MYDIHCHILIVMAVGGTVQAVAVPSRTTPYAILLLLLLAFSLGEQVNPLLRVRPLDGLDVARFQLYMVPVIVLVGLPFLATVGTALVDLLRFRKLPRWLPAVVSPIPGDTCGATGSRLVWTGGHR